MRFAFVCMATVAATSTLAAPSRLVIVSWDGAADTVVDRLLAEGKLPNLGRLAARGVSAEYSTPAFPSKTAVCHFTIFSGTHPDKSGVVGNAVPLLPKSEHTLLETRSGFDANSHFVEPLWVTAAKAGKKVVALSAAGSYPPAPDQARLREAGTPLDRYVEFSGFESNFSPGQLVKAADASPVDIAVGETKLSAKAVDTDGNGSYDAVSVTGTSTPLRLKPRSATNVLSFWSAPIATRKGDLTGNSYLRLFSLDGSTGAFELYVRGASAMKGTEGPEETAKYVDAYGGFHDDPFTFYQKGGLGVPLWEGGSGEAERRIVELVRLDCEFLKRSFRYAWKRWKPDLTFHYTPMSDSAGHTWMGVLDPESPAHNAELARKLLPFYEEVYRLQDDWLGDMMAVAGGETHFALVSDHGMSGISQYFAVNSVLAAAGLAAFEGGKIDLAKTQVCAPPWGDNLLVVNSTEWKGGIVPLADKESVLKAAELALANYRDPATGRPVVTRFFWPKTLVGLGIDGVATGDLYLDFAPGYYPSGRAGAPILSPADRPEIGSGVHGFWPQRRAMQAIFYMAGPRVPAGRTIPGIREVDIFPTLCKVLGIRPPADIDGHLIGDAVR